MRIQSYLTETRVYQIPEKHIENETEHDADDFVPIDLVYYSLEHDDEKEWDSILEKSLSLTEARTSAETQNVVLTSVDDTMQEVIAFVVCKCNFHV